MTTPHRHSLFFSLSEALWTDIRTVVHYDALKTGFILQRSADVFLERRKAGPVFYEAPDSTKKAYSLPTTAELCSAIREVAQTDRHSVSAIFQTAVRTYLAQRPTLIPTGASIDHRSTALGDQIASQRAQRFTGWPEPVPTPQHAATTLRSLRHQFAIGLQRTALLAILFEMFATMEPAGAAPVFHTTSPLIAARIGVTPQAVTGNLRHLRSRGLLMAYGGREGSHIDLRPTVVWLSSTLAELTGPLPSTAEPGLCESPPPPLTMPAALPAPRRAPKAERTSLISFGLSPELHQALKDLSANEGVRMDYLYEQAVNTLLQMRQAGPLTYEEAPRQTGQCVCKITPGQRHQLRQIAEQDRQTVSNLIQTGLRAYLQARARMHERSAHLPKE